MLFAVFYFFYFFIYPLTNPLYPIVRGEPVIFTISLGASDPVGTCGVTRKNAKECMFRMTPLICFFCYNDPKRRAQRRASE